MQKLATPCILSKEARQYIMDNCTMTGDELKPIIKEKFGVDVSIQAIIGHLKVARQNAEEATRTADSVIAQTIAERVSQYAPRILARYEKELERIESILDGQNPEFQLKIEEDGTRDKYWATKYTKLFDDLAKSYLSLRPPIQTVRVESVVDPQVACMETWSDEKIAEYEKFIQKLEEME